MTPTFTPEQLRVIRLGLETVVERLPNTHDGWTARGLLHRLSKAEKMIRDHGAAEAAF